MELRIIDGYTNTIIDVPGDSTGVVAYKGSVSSPYGTVTFFIQAKSKPAQGSASFPDISLEAFIYGNTGSPDFVFAVVDQGFSNLRFHNCTVTASGTNGGYVIISPFYDPKNDGGFPLNSLIPVANIIDNSPGPFSGTQPGQLSAVSPVSMGILAWTGQGFTDFTYFNAELQLSGLVHKGPPYPIFQHFVKAEGLAVPEPPS